MRWQHEAEYKWLKASTAQYACLEATAMQVSLLDAHAARRVKQERLALSRHVVQHVVRHVV